MSGLQDVVHEQALPGIPQNSLQDVYRPRPKQVRPQLYPFWMSWEVPDNTLGEHIIEAWPKTMMAWCSGSGVRGRDGYTTWVGIVFAANEVVAWVTICGCYGESAENPTDREVTSRIEAPPLTDEAGSRFPGASDFYTQGVWAYSYRGEV